jgi:hypothetical protein
VGKFLRLIAGIPRMVDEANAPTLYDASITIGAGGITTGVPITLPLSETYDSIELEVFLNGQSLEDAYDFNYYGTIPRTQITMTFDLAEGDILRFRMEN